MEDFVLDVVYKATVVEVTVVEANTKEEAIEKIKQDSGCVDIVDTFVEKEELIDIS